MNNQLNEEWLKLQAPKITSFISIFTKPDFTFCVEIPSRQDVGGYNIPSYNLYSREARDFIASCHDTGFINSDWLNNSNVSEERSRELRSNPKACESITVIEVASYLTFLSRAERFTSGSFDQAFRDGNILFILRRLEHLQH